MTNPDYVGAFAAQVLMDNARKQAKGRVIDLLKMVVANVRGINVDSLPRSGVGEVSEAEQALLLQIVPILLTEEIKALKIKAAA